MANPNESYTVFTYFSTHEWLQDRGINSMYALKCIVTRALIDAFSCEELHLFPVLPEKIEEWSSILTEDLGLTDTIYKDGEPLTKMLTLTQAWQAQTMAADLVSEFAASLPKAN